MKKKTWIQIMMAVFIMLVGVLYSSSNCYAAEKTEITVNSFYQLNENTQMRENASESAKEVQELVAGVSLVVPVFTLMIAFGDIFGLGGSSLISRLFGEKRLEEAQDRVCPNKCINSYWKCRYIECRI